jgi:hypothetical protein
LTVAPADIAALRKREFGYNLRPVVCVRWGVREAAPFTAYVLVAAEGTRSGPAGDRQMMRYSIRSTPGFAGLEHTRYLRRSSSFTWRQLFSLTARPASLSGRKIIPKSRRSHLLEENELATANGQAEHSMFFAGRKRALCRTKVRRAKCGFL